MKPVYLSQFQLCSALADNLPQAAIYYAQGKQPLPTYADDVLSLPYFAVPSSDKSLHLRLKQLLKTTLDAANLTAADCLLLVASTALDVGLLEQRLEQGVPLSYALMPSYDSFSQKVDDGFNFAAVRIINTACTSAANALLYSQRFLQLGLYRHVLVLAFEPPGKITRSGFSTLELTSQSGQYRPFHPQRDGLILGEAYATAIVSKTADFNPIAKLLGGYSACDTYNITTTAEDGNHIAQVMQLALEKSGVNQDEIALLKLHGTATPANDTAETNGILRLFTNKVPPLAVLKPYLGHTLGACGLSELALLFTTLQDNPLPALPYANEASLPFSNKELSLNTQDIVMANFFGFGGNNASLLLRKC
ncbi:beta-ketoacyl synthase N-terminal-like domain-containing protein [Rheinheimera sp. MMS21-TC3]|uniref:beta-ketoacyl synthase N-terminal-like domain-containing protein n=1 Tax=Rheinheimera sp. MMS21-TC3 TaxID=3072790 RepID=UPI0028C41985|nr:beta-ketoacyl synthase N-terminal-like domain-containing protein [Rheinheimera sp. MMS21-TC3]WNO59522.1 beta-ketoacyl synthase N-terminal-like domain-containing protein [Rheinheimera sp. MMS21-TC3]